MNRDSTVEKGDEETASPHSPWWDWLCHGTQNHNHVTRECVIRPQPSHVTIDNVMMQISRCNNVSPFISSECSTKYPMSNSSIDIPELISFVSTLMLTFIKLHAEKVFH